MHDALKSSSGYHKELDEALNDEFLRRTLDTFAVAYRANREADRGVPAQEHAHQHEQHHAGDGDIAAGEGDDPGKDGVFLARAVDVDDRDRQQVGR